MNLFKKTYYQEMNSRVSIKLTIAGWSFILFGLTLMACQKEKDYIYEVNPVSVSAEGSGKSNRKTTAEFISIAWADFFGTQVPQSELLKLNTVYTAFGDKELIEDRILLNLIARPGVQIPAQVSVNGDTSAFIVSAYQRLYNREPSAFEDHYLKEQIRLNSAMTPKVIWYALMSSEEYRYY